MKNLMTPVLLTLLAAFASIPAWAAPQLQCSTETQYGVERREIIIYYGVERGAYRVGITPVVGNIPHPVDRLEAPALLDARGIADSRAGFDLVFANRAGTLTARPTGLFSGGLPVYEGLLTEAGFAPAAITCTLGG
jgi:hypothetical protein